MSPPPTVLLGNRMTDAIWWESQLLYDTEILGEIAVCVLLFQLPPALSDLDIVNLRSGSDAKATNKAVVEWLNRHCSLEGNPEALWFIWQDHVHCKSPQAVARAANHAADLMLQKDPFFEDVIRPFGEGQLEEGEAVDLDLRDPRYSREAEHVRPQFIWTMRGVAKAARLAEATGSTLVTLAALA
jgi:hypothetical protein